MIETAPEEYWKQLSYTDAVLYCFSLNIDGKIGWRLPTQAEIRTIVGSSKSWRYWYTADYDTANNITDFEFTIIPVRDLKDD